MQIHASERRRSPAICSNSFGPRNALFEEAVRDAAPVLEWVREQSRRENLSPAGFGAGIHAATDAGELTEEETPQVVRSLLAAGVDTTVSALSCAIYALSIHPAEHARLHAEPGLARAAFDEAVRWDSPVQTFFRTTTRATEPAGLRIGEGEKVLMLLGSANRDPRKWPDPDRYHMTRRPAGRVGFGAGIHACVGMALARLEGECVLAALARRVRAVEPAGPPRRRLNNTLRGLASLPVRLVPA